MRGAIRSWTDDELIAAVRSNTCLTDVVRSLGLRAAGGSHASIKRHITRLALSMAHFTNDRRTRGLTAIRNQKRRPLADIFCSGSAVTGKVLRRASLKLIVPYQCAECQNPGLHNGRPLTLQLHHINGIFNDNRPANLAWSCPNCHSQTDSFAGKGTRARPAMSKPAYAPRTTADDGLTILTRVP